MKPANTLKYTILLPRQNEYARVCPPKHSLRLFLRTIIEYPHLAKNIKKLVLGSWTDSMSLYKGLRPHLRPIDDVETRRPELALRQTYIDVLERLGGPRSSRDPRDIIRWLEFIDHVLDGRDGSELILLILSIPNLQTLYLAQMPVFGYLMVVGAGGLANHLEVIRLGSVDKLQLLYLYHLSVLMSLPKLRALILVNCSALGHDYLPRPRANLTCLSILHCIFSKDTFELLTKNISNLESFEWIGLPYGTPLPDFSRINYHNGIARKILDFVNRQKPTLRNLHLLGSGFTFVFMDRLSFKDFESLERLEICYRPLHDESMGLSDQLPQSLKHLRINQSCSHMTHKLEVLVSSRALPNIVKIEYGPISVISFMQLLFEGSNLDEFRKIKRLCAIEGITFVQTVEDVREMEAEAGS